MKYNVYCDESCHLENDNIHVMVWGAIWCLKEKKSEIFKRIREIKVECGLAKDFEIKWNKVSPARTDFYLRLIDYFFDDDDIHFRALVVPDKSIPNHEQVAVLVRPRNSFNTWSMRYPKGNTLYLDNKFFNKIFNYI
ncbi:hypothetical protein AGMMS50262_01430 [Bacteroidia bacterium]|nr:hypothetical protein AGMMS50262_01430 [Bacteroidia bacterium]